MAENTFSTNTVTVTMEDEETQTTYNEWLHAMCHGTLPGKVSAIVRKKTISKRRQRTVGERRFL